MLLLPTGLVAPTQRTIPAFALHRPGSLGEAVAAGAAPGAVYAQGCSDLFAQFREGLRCESLVALDRVPELGRVAMTDGGLEIGSGVAHHDGAHDDTVRGALPSFAEAWGRIANHRIRQRATIGGNLMARRTRYEMSVMLQAAGARLRFLTADGPLELDPAALWDREEPHGALLTSIVLPGVHGLWFGYERSMRPLATAAVAVRGDRVTLTVGSEYTRPHTVRLAPDDDPVKAAERLPDSVGDAAASAGYRRHLAGVLLRRLLETRAARKEGR
ncbi:MULTISPECIES: xanthine dehydrogenase family protein subunit M [Streptomyces]|uniref:Dehydrogenase n=1 Tax=Streptomyces lycii TaxID=2654337 RepID=A0ABQ7FJY4_9ACTN|nr:MULTISPECIES: FAD binding domain-containing protein [Streptomyces]KAF4409000.1 dehydrogenase [Streptomyces lycii]PGH52083.1 dehydrogenase [Streptomyces sp. Ru87]